jgi:4-amino-4-deoxy-L-arabinose transferase-like glycosyltransferase
MWILVFAVALALRVAYAWVAVGPGAQPYSDPAEYDTVAWNLASGLGFSLVTPAGSLYATAVSPPLLPWVVSLLYVVVGHQYFAAVLLQCLIGALAPLLVMALGGAMFGGRVSRLAGWLSAVHPLLVFFSAYLLTETWLVVTMLLALWLSMEWARAPRPLRAVAAGLAWGLASLARPTALLLPLVMVAWAWVPLRLMLSPARRVGQVALLLLGLVLALAPWTLRNALVFDAFIPVASRGGGALYVGNNPQVWNDLLRRGGGADYGFYGSVEEEFEGLSEVERDARARQRALAFLGAHVTDWPAMALAKLQRFWRVSSEGGGTGTWQRPGSPLGRLFGWVDPLLLWSLVMFPLALWGLVRILRGPRRWFLSLLLWVILYFNLLAVVFWGSLRMRLPIEPFLVLLVAVAAEDLRRRLRRGRPSPA